MSSDEQKGAVGNGSHERCKECKVHLTVKRKESTKGVGNVSSRFQLIACATYLESRAEAASSVRRLDRQQSPDTRDAEEAFGFCAHFQRRRVHPPPTGQGDV